MPLVPIRRPMLSLTHSKCRFLHKTAPGTSHNPPKTVTHIDLNKLYTLMQELSVRLEVLEMDVCNQNLALNALYAMVRPMYSTYAATTQVASAAGKAVEDIGIVSTVAAFFGI